jgi:hypothetical protein
MDVQNEVAQEWFAQNLQGDEPQQLLDEIYPLLKATYDVTRERVGGLEILQSLRAIAPLQDLRLTSHRLIAEQFAELLSGLLPQISSEALFLQARLSIDMGYGMVEMALEDETLAADEVLKQGAVMIQQYWQRALEKVG